MKKSIETFKTMRSPLLPSLTGAMGLICVLLGLCLSLVTFAEAVTDKLAASESLSRTRNQSRSGASINNQYVDVILTDELQFGMRTTGGDPANPDDNDKPMVYHYSHTPPREPETSKDTVLVDGQPWVVGDAGDGHLGFPAVATGDILAARFDFHNGIRLQKSVQLVDFVTGRHDTAEIRVTVTNAATGDSLVGYRFLLDTLLGNNDGAMILLEGQTSPSFYEQEFPNPTYPGVPEFWFAWEGNDIIDPGLIARGYLRGYNTIPPDRVGVAHWSKANPTMWDYTFDPLQSYSDPAYPRERDSSFIMWWNERTLRPGESLEAITYYGLAPQTASRNSLQVAVQAPSELVWESASMTYQPEEFTLYTNIYNPSGASVDDVEARLTLPPGIERLDPLAEPEVRTVSNILGQEFTELRWRVRANGVVTGIQNVRLDVEIGSVPDCTVDHPILVPDMPLNTPTPTPTATPTPDLTPPNIRLAGYGQSSLSLSAPGVIEFIAYVDTGGVGDDEKVEIFFGFDTSMGGVELDPNFAGGANGVYGLSFPLDAGVIPPGSYSFSMVATDRSGNRSRVWPFVPVEQCLSPAPLPAPRKAVGQLIRDFIQAAGKSSLRHQEQRFAESAERPLIYLGGYWDTLICNQSGGDLDLRIVVVDSDPLDVELYYAGMETGVYLTPLGGVLYQLSVAGIPPGLPENILLEAVAHDQAGNASAVWPHLTAD